MIFSPALIGAVLDGSKTQTRRPVKYEPYEHLRLRVRVGEVAKPCSYKVGKTYAVQPGRGQNAVARVRVLEVTRESIRAISLDDAIAEGFDSPVSFIGWWSDRHGSAALLGECWRIRFELALA